MVKVTSPLASRRTDPEVWWRSPPPAGGVPTRLVTRPRSPPALRSVPCSPVPARADGGRRVRADAGGGAVGVVVDHGGDAGGAQAALQAGGVAEAVDRDRHGAAGLGLDGVGARGVAAGDGEDEAGARGGHA